MLVSLLITRIHYRKLIMYIHPTLNRTAAVPEKALTYAEVVKRPSPQRPPVDEASTKEPAIAYARNTRRWVRNNDDRGQAGTITIDSKNNTG